MQPGGLAEACWKRIAEIRREFAAKWRRLDRDGESSLVRVKKLSSMAVDFAESLLSEGGEGADAEMAAHAGRSAEHLRLLARLLTEIERLDGERQARNAEANSADAQIGEIVRFLIAGPAPSNPEVPHKTRRMDGRADSLEARLADWQAAADKLDTEELLLRQRLAARYQRPFPPLSPAQDPKRNAYSETELAGFKSVCESKAAELGRFLLSETHPTSAFRSATLDSFSPAGDRESVVVEIRCDWAGGLTGTAYMTRFQAVIDKRKGLLELSVPKDTAVISIAATNMLNARSRLAELIRKMR